MQAIPPVPMWVPRSMLSVLRGAIPPSVPVHHMPRVEPPPAAPAANPMDLDDVTAVLEGKALLKLTIVGGESDVGECSGGEKALENEPEFTEGADTASNGDADMQEGEPGSLEALARWPELAADVACEAARLAKLAEDALQRKKEQRSRKNAKRAEKRAQRGKNGRARAAAPKSDAALPDAAADAPRVDAVSENHAATGGESTQSPMVPTPVAPPPAPPPAVPPGLRVPAPEVNSTGVEGSDLSETGGKKRHRLRRPRGNEAAREGDSSGAEGGGQQPQ